jgi:formylglycine-generating enzyme required for sulfatase activity
MQVWQSGQQIDQYVIKHVLGSGGFGITYLAQDKRSNRRFAIKTLNPVQQGKSDFSQQQQKFINEALRLASCKHPQIVSVREMVLHQGLQGMVMEYIVGEDLATYIDRQGVLSEDEALRIIRQVGEALTCVHEAGFLHRDVKPNNIMLREGSQSPVLIDFGLAREFNLEQIRSLTNSRTDGFAPIEQYKKRGEAGYAEPGPYTDVYALAATLYEVLTKQTPIPANFRYELKIPLPPPQQLNSRISARVNDAIIEGMSVLPKDRPQSIKQWLKSLLGSVGKTFSFEVVTVDKFGKKINRQRRQAEYFVESLGNGVALDMVYVPGGTFLMGSPDGEGDADEHPQHAVTVAAFHMGKYPVTQAQWRAVAALPQVNRSLNADPSEFKGNNRPVECVSWYDAVEFCDRLSAKTGKTYRLPSEAEWEYSCRAGTTTPFYFGATLTTDLANYDGNYTFASEGKGKYRQQTTDVDSFPPNAFGLYDLHGNALEWCADNWLENYNGASSYGNTWLDGDDSIELLCGGSWSDSPRYCRCAFRIRYHPDGRDDDFGFRVISPASRTL